MRRDVLGKTVNETNADSLKEFVGLQDGLNHHPLGTLIAAHALALECILVTNNESEFSRIPGLAIENWAA